MKKNNSLSILITFLLLSLSSCSEKKSDQVDLVNETFPEAQKELREVINSIVEDSETANLEGHKASQADNRHKVFNKVINYFELH